MPLRRPVIERDPQHQPRPMRLDQRRQRLLHPGAHHRPHRIGQDQNLVTSLERRLRHGAELGVHERLAAGESDLAHRPAARRDLIEKIAHLRLAEIDQPVILGGTLDIAVDAGDVAQRSGVEPQRPRSRQRHPRAGLAVGGNAGIEKLALIDGLFGGVLHACVTSCCSLLPLMRRGFKEKRSAGW